MSTVMDPASKVEFSKTLTDRDDLLIRAKRAQHALNEVLGSSRDSVRSSWDFHWDERGRELILLRLVDTIDPKGSVSAEFAPTEIDDEWHLRRRLYSKWGELLQNQSRQMVADLKEIVQDLDQD